MLCYRKSQNRLIAYRVEAEKQPETNKRGRLVLSDAVSVCWRLQKVMPSIDCCIKAQPALNIPVLSCDLYPRSILQDILSVIDLTFSSNSMFFHSQLTSIPSIICRWTVGLWGCCCIRWSMAACHLMEGTTKISFDKSAMESIENHPSHQVLVLHKLF